MNLGELARRMFGGRSKSGRVKPETTAEMIERGIREAGGVSQLARSLGVARTTVQRWRKGSTPSDESEQLLRTVLRRHDVPASRIERIAASDTFTISGKQDGRNRTIRLGRYLEPGTMQKAANAFMNGASSRDLHIIIWAGITDQNYRWMLQPKGWTPSEAARVVQTFRASPDTAPPPIGAYGAAGGAGGDDGEDLGEPDEYGNDYWFDETPYEDEDDYGDLFADFDIEVPDNSGYEFSGTSASS